MSMQTWQETIATQAASGTNFLNYTTAKTVINSQALVSLPPNYLQLGKRLRITIVGGQTNVITAQCSFTFNVMFGSVIVHTSGAILSTTTAHTNAPFRYVIDMRCNAVGIGTTAKMLSVGTLTGQGFVISGATTDVAGGGYAIQCPVTAPAEGTGFDSTIANVLDFFVALGAANAANGVQIFSYDVEVLN